MTFFRKFLIFGAFIASTYSRSLPGENFLELENTNCSCDWRYFKHYETKGCLVEVTDSCGCPQKFTCPSNQTQQTPAKVCTYQNKEYKVRSKIISSNVCQVCWCRDGVPPYISCISRECPQIDPIPSQDCHLIYAENRCCPLGVECFANETEVTRNKTCEYNGRFYPFGSKIYPVDDPCQTCICDENWNDGDNSSCHEHDCMFEKNKSKLDAGCIPVYHESRCCPIEFYCPSSHNSSFSALSGNESSDNYNASYENECIFAGQSYALGQELSIGNPCVKCMCLVPPDFTCVHQSCPPSPSDESCYVNYNSEECCPTYECMLGDVETHPDGCPTPLCADSSCRIEIPDGHECPTCVCAEPGSELEHNDIEQVSQDIGQHINQNIEQQFEPVQQVFEPMGITDDYSEEDLQMMPIRMQDSEEMHPVMEKMILPEIDDTNQYPEEVEELEESAFDDNFSTEAVSAITNDIQAAELKNSTYLAELELDDSYNKSEKNIQKRSGAAKTSQTVVEQKISQEDSSEDIEREGGESDGRLTDFDDFDDALENMKNKFINYNRTIINEIHTINHEVEVPPGCPTPMCEGSWCKIGILPGHECPTCICKRSSEP